MHRMVHRRYSLSAVVHIGLILILACCANAQSLSNHITRSDRSASQAEPRILLFYDMEGISNIDRLAMTSCDSGDDYVRGVAGLEADVNAVIDGLFVGGAGAVIVQDEHGSGCEDDPDLPAGRLDKRASYVDLKNDKTPVWERKWDALVLVGAHAGSGSGGFLAHTNVPGFTRLVNGRPISESEMQAYSIGEYGVPVVFVSGDDVLGASLGETMPWIEYVQVKRMVNWSSAISGDAKTAARDLRDGAARAIRSLGTARPLRVASPFTAGLRALPPVSFGVLDGVPGVALHDQTVEFTAANFDEARRGWRALQRAGLTVLRLDLLTKPEYKTKTLGELLREAEVRAAKKSPSWLGPTATVCRSPARSVLSSARIADRQGRCPTFSPRSLRVAAHRSETESPR